MILQAFTTSFKSELLRAIHDFSTDTFKLALYSSSADLSEATTAYTSTNEVGTAGGYTLTAILGSGSGAAWVDFTDVAIATSAVARGGLLYNSSKSNKSVMALDFGMNRTFPGTVTFPVADQYTAFLRIK